MQCPKCQSTMEEKTYGAKISIQRCSHCKGLFAKPRTLLEMQEEWMADAVLDVGDPGLGKEYDKTQEINCPECGSKMHTFSDPGQPHVWLESCPNCEGIFLDAGEFTNLKYETLADKARDLIRGKHK